MNAAPSWWGLLWLKMRARYPSGSQFLATSSQEYWEDLCEFTEEEIWGGFRLAMRVKPDWFPPSPLIYEKCLEFRKQVEKAQRDAEAAHQQSRPQLEAYTTREEWGLVGSATTFLIERGVTEVQDVANQQDLLRLARKHGWRAPNE